ncbi:MAG: deoxynucleoside kinase [Flavobacteriales bacterium]|jgi:deoxyadenosine/deoxycytidine kinase|nr:deoxynucleoside kinase [Flavobacteriales bacterium]MBK6893665.1 deoxynucleoside kinase [Flavobacteriales bacterium]MBK7248623.1 deoxynucleoside kinase [Flavobacteriales bacterium]MBK9059150.1 deoxynucleoside kinase [Flavobacteriales bacterium]MBK9597912.1 deoxynucleoside kinase [Flavobacteriales bacterium]
MKPPYGYIAVEGLIGAGKTTLAKRLAAEWDAETVLEEFEDNPFLPQFYQDPTRHAFTLELSFLAQRYHQLKRVGERSLFHPATVADYSIGKSLIFAGVTLPPDEHALFRDLYAIMYAGLPKPELLVYLHLPMATVRERIRARGRTYEQRISEEYLGQLQERYLDHLRKLDAGRVLVVDLNGKDLLKDAVAYQRFMDLVTAVREPGHHVEHL